MLTASVFFLYEFPPLPGLKHFFCIFLLLLHLSGEARRMEQKQKDTKEDDAPLFISESVSSHIQSAPLSLFQVGSLFFIAEPSSRLGHILLHISLDALIEWVYNNR